MLEINQANYRAFPAVSNSDLGALQKYWLPEDRIIDLEKAYANGTLIDCMITEPHKVNFFKRTVEDETYQYSRDEFEAAEEMKKAFYRDTFCAHMAKNSTFQKISYNPSFSLEYDGLTFSLPAKAKWDCFVQAYDMSGDIKSTACTTQKQCEEALRHFEYPRQSSWYMDLENRNNFMFMFISKVNFKVFKIPVKRDSELYREGKAKYANLAFNYWSLFGDIKL